MLIQYFRMLRNTLACFILVSMQMLAFPSTSLAQDEGLSFEQAQTRTTYARKKMQKARHALEEAESREEATLQELHELQKRQDEVRKQVEQATQERQSANKQYQQAHDQWSQEAERLKRLHKRSH